MSAGQASTPVATGRSALCVYGMAELDTMLRQAQEVCYTEGGRGSSGQEEAYIEYAVSSKCLRLPKVSLSEYPCGGEHTPNPIASAVPLQATPTFTSTTQLTAVTTATEAGHTIAFLGDREGRLHKVLVRPDRSGDLYGSVSVDSGSVVSADLLLDDSQQHVYVLTNSRLSKVPVSSCERQTDCQSCLTLRDPYCGWCVLEGRCSRKHQCQRHLQSNHWLWSFEPTNQCVTVQSLQPANQSKDEQTQVTLSVVQLPILTESESLSCVFGLLPPRPVVMGTSITCQSPHELLPPSIPQEACYHFEFCGAMSQGTTVVLQGQSLDVYTDEAQYVCVVEIQGVQVNLTAAVERTPDNTHTFTCSPHQFQ
ncbi:plexin-B1-like isoform X1, partial [Lates japonicus]